MSGARGLATHLAINAIPAPNAPHTKFKALFQRLFKTRNLTVLASEAKQSATQARRQMDCFVASLLAMTVEDAQAA
jgi:hypothetical protein